MKLILIACALGAAIKPIDSDSISTSGTEFVFGIINSYIDSAAINMYAIVSNQNSDTTQIAITSPFSDFQDISRDVSAGTTLMIPITPVPIQIRYNTPASYGIISENKGIFLTSRLPVRVFVHVENANGKSGDTYQVFPRQLLGTRYRAATSIRPSTTGTAAKNANIIAVIAYTDDTTVQIGNQSITLNQFQSASVSSTSGLSGTLITSNNDLNPIGVITGCTSGTTIDDSDANYEAIMLLPTNRWSTLYVGLPLHNASGSGINAIMPSAVYEAIADVNGTKLTYFSNPVGQDRAQVEVTLQEGEPFPFTAAPGLINSTQPIQLIQIGQQVGRQGAAFFMRAPSVEMMSNVSILVQPTGFVGLNNSAIHYWIRIYAHLNSIGNISIGNDPPTSAALYRRIVPTSYYYYEKEYTNSSYLLNSTTPDAKFSAIVYTYKQMNGCGYQPLPEVSIPSPTTEGTTTTTASGTTTTTTTEGTTTTTTDTTTTTTTTATATTTTTT
jgi:hypothetical protein